MNGYLNNPTKFKQVVYESAVSIFKENDKSINPLKYIESRKEDACNQALLRIVSKINLDAIREIFDEIPEEEKGMSIFSKEQKAFYFEMLKFKYYEILLPIYNVLRESK